MKNKPWNTNTEKEALAMLYLLPAAHSDRPGCGPAFSMALLNSMWTQILKTVSSFAAIVQLLSSLPVLYNAFPLVLWQMD